MQAFKNLITTIQEDIIGTENRTIAIVWLACIAGVIGLGFYVSSESRSFLGVADSREMQITFENPVTIKKMHVITGQNVRKGELIMELDQSELNEKIRLTRNDLAKMQTEKQIRKQLNLLVSNADDTNLADPLSIDINILTDLLESLEEQKKNLYVFASVDGVVGTVNYRKGEKAPAFSPILTLSPQNPTYVEGFIHENFHTQLEVGRTVFVTPVSGGDRIEGKIASVGSRIILMPLRLMPYPGMNIYGRELVVEIPQANSFLIGEKVQIKPKIEFIFLTRANASDKKLKSVDKNLEEPQEVILPASLQKQYQFEPSGALYLEDMKKYLVVSDDTDEDKSATLFLMNEDGKVDEQVVKVPGIDEISDIESISQVGQKIYLMASHSLTKKGKDKKERNLFVRTDRSGITLANTEIVELKPLLIKAIKNSKDSVIKDAFSKQKFGDIDIESHALFGKDLYLGLKHPLAVNNQSIILRIRDFENLFSKKTLDSEKLTLWRKVNFQGAEGAPHRLSDLMNINGDFYATSVCEDETCGAVWKLTDDKSLLTGQLIKFYKDAKPEGLGFNNQQQTLFVVFDQKLNTAKYARIRLSTDKAEPAPDKKSKD